jgi:hypothetical protein
MSLSCLVWPGRTARMSAVLLALFGLLSLSGCWVTSINPLYEEGSLGAPQDTDLVFDQTLVGSWSSSSDKCKTLLTITAKDGVYDLQSIDRGEGCGEEKSHQQGRLVKLGEHYFLDVSPINDDVCEMCAAKHSIFLAEIDKATLSLTPIDSDWLKKSIAAGTVTLTTVAGDTDTITASSRDLKAFCRKFAEDEAVFKPDSTNTLERNPVSRATDSSQQPKAKRQ